jgi:hypothetical protein
MDDLPGSFCRRFIARRIGRIIDDLAVVPLPRSLGGDDRSHVSRRVRRSSTPMTHMVMAGGLDISRANPFRQGGQQRLSVRLRPEAP